MWNQVYDVLSSDLLYQQVFCVSIWHWPLLILRNYIEMDQHVQKLLQLKFRITKMSCICSESLSFVKYPLFPKSSIYSNIEIWGATLFRQSLPVHNINILLLRHISILSYIFDCYLGWKLKFWRQNSFLNDCPKRNNDQLHSVNSDFFLICQLLFREIQTADIRHRSFQNEYCSDSCESNYSSESPYCFSIRRIANCFSSSGLFH